MKLSALVALVLTVAATPRPCTPQPAHQSAGAHSLEPISSFEFAASLHGAVTGGRPMGGAGIGAATTVSGAYWVTPRVSLGLGVTIVDFEPMSQLLTIPGYHVDITGLSLSVMKRALRSRMGWDIRMRPSYSLVRIPGFVTSCMGWIVGCSAQSSGSEANEESPDA